MSAPMDTDLEGVKTIAREQWRRGEPVDPLTAWTAMIGLSQIAPLLRSLHFTQPKHLVYLSQAELDKLCGKLKLKYGKKAQLLHGVESIRQELEMKARIRELRMMEAQFGDKLCCACGKQMRDSPPKSQRKSSKVDTAKKDTDFGPRVEKPESSEKKASCQMDGVELSTSLSPVSTAALQLSTLDVKDPPPLELGPSHHASHTSPKKLKEHKYRTPPQEAKERKDDDAPLPTVAHPPPAPPTQLIPITPTAWDMPDFESYLSFTRNPENFELIDRQSLLTWVHDGEAIVKQLHARDALHGPVHFVFTETNHIAVIEIISSSTSFPTPRDQNELARLVNAQDKDTVLNLTQLIMNLLNLRFRNSIPPDYACFVKFVFQVRGDWSHLPEYIRELDVAVAKKEHPMFLSLT